MSAGARRSLAASLGAALLLVGCTPAAPSPAPETASDPTSDPAPGTEPPDPTAGPTLGPDGPTADPRYALVQQLLDDRAAAVRTGDLAAFTAGLATGPGVAKGFVEEQRRWFRNLQELPVGVLSYEVGTQQWDPAQLPARRDRAAGVFLPVVTTGMRLRGFDDAPVSRVGGFTVSRTDEGYKVVAVDDVEGTEDAALGRAPWDLVELDVRRQDEAGRTLLLLDAASADRGPTLLEEMARGTTRVQQAVPFDWDGDVVAYATGAAEVIAAIDDVPGGDVARVGALAFPVYEEPGRPRVASFRFALNPEVLRSDSLFLRRLVTHELLHVAVGTRDDGAPVWVSEGLAEYVGALGLAPTETRIAISVVQRARTIETRLAQGRPVDLSLPASDTFNGPAADWHYGLSWYAMEWIAAERGEDAVWRLVRRMAAGGGTSDEDQDAVLRRVLGIGSEQLVRNAVDLILTTYDR